MPSQVLGKQLAAKIFPGYNWDDPQLRKRKARPDDDGGEEEEEEDDDDDDEGGDN